MARNVAKKVAGRKDIMTKPLTRSAVRIYGALSGLGNGSADILEKLLPFFDPILRRFNGSKLDPSVIAATIRDTYKWNINSDVVEMFVDHLVRQGWLIPDTPNSKDTTFTIQITDNGGPSDEIHTVEAELRQIALQFKDFSDRLSPLTSLPRDVEEFEDILIEWLLYVEMFSDKNIDFKVTTATDATGTMRRFVEVPSLTSLRDEDKYLCARFVREMLSQSNGTGEVLSRIAAIGLLTEVVQDFVKPVTHIAKTDLVVYLDAPVALEFLGVSGKAAQENISPVIHELIRIGAAVRIFGQSIEEIKRSLKTVLSNERPYGPTADALRRREVLRDYVVAVAQDPASFLEKLNVKLTSRTLKQNPNEHQYFSVEHWQDLYGRLNFMSTVEGRQHDADVTAFVVRQRTGKANSDIFRSGFILLTRNGLLSQTVRKMCNEVDLLPDNMVPPVVHRRVLATAMWLRTGMGSADLNIPRRMLLASCEQVLAIRPNVVDAVRKLTDALGDDDKSKQLELLISQDRSVSALMDKTLGSANVVTNENLALLWDEMLHPHLEGERQKSANALKREKAEAKKRLEREKEQLEAIKSSSREQREAFTSALQIKKSEDREAVEALCFDAERSLSRKRKLVVGIGIAIALLSCVPLFLSPSPVTLGITAAVTALFAYLTATGGRLIGVNTDQPKALAKLRQLASSRRLTPKLELFILNWDGRKFRVDDKPIEAALKNEGNGDLFKTDA